MVERIPELTLSNGVKMPRLGFGVCLMPDGEVTSAAVLDALAVGYRNIDTAAAYGNEAGVGSTQAGAPAPSGFPTSWRITCRRCSTAAMLRRW